MFDGSLVYSESMCLSFGVINSNLVFTGRIKKLKRMSSGIALRRTCGTNAKLGPTNQIAKACYCIFHSCTFTTLNDSGKCLNLDFLFNLQRSTATHTHTSTWNVFFLPSRKSTARTTLLWMDQSWHESRCRPSNASINTTMNTNQLSKTKIRIRHFMAKKYLLSSCGHLIECACKSVHRASVRSIKSNAQHANISIECGQADEEDESKNLEFFPRKNEGNCTESETEKERCTHSMPKWYREGQRNDRCIGATWNEMLQKTKN